MKKICTDFQLQRLQFFIIWENPRKILAVLHDPFLVSLRLVLDGITYLCYYLCTKCLRVLVLPQAKVELELSNQTPISP